MLRHFHCPPNPITAPHVKHPLVLTWDDQTGEVSGPGAVDVALLLALGFVEAGGHPRCAWPVDRDTLKTRAGLALIVGHAWVLPPELVDDYPASEVQAEPFPDVAIVY